MTYWVYMASAKGANYDFVELEAQVQFLLECMGNVPAQLVETPPSFIVAFKFLLDSNTFCDLFNEQQEALPGGALYTADSPVSEGEGPTGWEDASNKHSRSSSSWSASVKANPGEASQHNYNITAGHGHATQPSSGKHAGAGAPRCANTAGEGTQCLGRHTTTITFKAHPQQQQQVNPVHASSQQAHGGRKASMSTTMRGMAHAAVTAVAMAGNALASSQGLREPQSRPKAGSTAGSYRRSWANVPTEAKVGKQGAKVATISSVNGSPASASMDEPSAPATAGLPSSAPTTTPATATTAAAASCPCKVAFPSAASTSAPSSAAPAAIPGAPATQAASAEPAAGARSASTATVTPTSTAPIMGSCSTGSGVVETMAVPAASITTAGSTAINTEGQVLDSTMPSALQAVASSSARSSCAGAADCITDSNTTSNRTSSAGGSSSDYGLFMSDEQRAEMEARWRLLLEPPRETMESVHARWHIAYDEAVPFGVPYSAGAGTSGVVEAGPQHDMPQVALPGTDTDVGRLLRDVAALRQGAAKLAQQATLAAQVQQQQALKEQQSRQRWLYFEQVLRLEEKMAFDEEPPHARAPAHAPPPQQHAPQAAGFAAQAVPKQGHSGNAALAAMAAYNGLSPTNHAMVPGGMAMGPSAGMGSFGNVFAMPPQAAPSAMVHPHMSYGHGPGSRHGGF